jgi:hypothetical protein
MTKEDFLQLVKQYSNETVFLSFTKRDHPAFIKLLAEGPSILPWLLERLKDSIGHDGPDHGGEIDLDNCPWLSTHLIGELSTSTCWGDFPEEHAGKLVKIRDHLLKWGETQGHIKL